ncbi:hypothetical protein A2U01_0067540, partial [Trifolium medium]|nr:hypothetical protein [Trifolium medium]
AVDDVWGIGKAIGVNFKGDNVNLFSALSRAGRSKQTKARLQQGHGGTLEEDC